MVPVWSRFPYSLSPISVRRNQSIEGLEMDSWLAISRFSCFGHPQRALVLWISTLFWRNSARCSSTLGRTFLQVYGIVGHFHVSLEAAKDPSRGVNAPICRFAISTLWHRQMTSAGLFQLDGFLGLWVCASGCALV